jgi:hypothetical protein
MAKTVSPVVNLSISDAPRYIWAELATGDTINGLRLSGTGARRGAVQISGTFGSATVKIQTSNDGTNFYDIKDIHNTAVSTTAAAIFEITSAALFIKPAISGGSADSVNVTLFMRD